MADNLDHLRVVGFADPRPFKSTLSVRKPKPPARDRAAHGARLLADLDAVVASAEATAARRRDLHLPEHLGLTVALEVSPPKLLDFSSLEWRREGIEVLNVTATDTSEVVTLHVPEGGLRAFEKRIQDYLNKNTKKGRPKNSALIDVIESFRRAAFDELWTDERAPPAPGEAAQWFQLWLRQVGTPQATRDRLVEVAQRMDLVLEDGFIPFPGRVVVAGFTTRQSLERAIEVLDSIAEIRFVATTAEFFLSDLTPADQIEWVRNLQDRLRPGDSDDPPYLTESPREFRRLVGVSHAAMASSRCC